MSRNRQALVIAAVDGVAIGRTIGRAAPREPGDDGLSPIMVSLRLE